MRELGRLQEWYARHYRGVLGHRPAISLATLDNPGWSLKVDLANTDLEEREMVEIEIDRSEEDWIAARRSGNFFEAFGGTKNLTELLGIFLDWAQVPSKPAAADKLDWLSDFFQSLCNGDWEHGFGCRIETSDSPGWHFTFDFSNTIFQEVAFQPVVDLRTETDWVNCRKEGAQFVADGGVGNLDELIGNLRRWVEATGL